MVLLPLVCSRVSVPVIAAGGFCDGASMAAAFALGAEGIQMGTRMLSVSESPVHDNWKRAIVAAQETDTVMLNRGGKGPALRALRTTRTARIEQTLPDNIMAEFAGIEMLYFGGDMEAAVPLTGQVCGRIDSVLPVRRIIDETIAQFTRTVDMLASRYGST
ncbi:NAD(P)H-dependent flavin oxidoreductase [Burkholderia catarinensis]|uniref:NAD(P)H-dependent flavin oxidoreductase n=1 Tax=Burkholderia catarinensis TaxID=1108140 RepID=UPI000A6A55F6|nr:nitronate monooxygenase [Burkholderia catarinensis]